MARIFTEGFEMQDLLFFDATGSAGFSTPRSGAASLNLGYQGWGNKTIVDLAEAYFRFGFRFNGYQGAIFVWYNGGTRLGYIGIDSSRRLVIYTGNVWRAIGTITLSLSAWYLIEVHVLISDTGVVEVRLDGILDVSYSGDTKPGAEETINVCRYCGNEVQFDDLAMNDISGTVDNSWCGDGKVVMLTPNANGDLSQLMGSDADQIDNYLLVDEFPKDDDTTYVEGSVVDEKDLYNFTDFGLNVQEIKRVWAEARARDTVADAGLVALALKTYATEYVGPDVTLFTTFTKQILGTVHTVNPNTSAAWTPAELDALQAGPVTRS